MRPVRRVQWQKFLNIYEAYEKAVDTTLSHHVKVYGDDLSCISMKVSHKNMRKGSILCRSIFMVLGNWY
jgi:hypothetical protein